jgi:hypothetical protein
MKVGAFISVAATQHTGSVRLFIHKCLSKTLTKLHKNEYVAPDLPTTYRRQYLQSKRPPQFFQELFTKEIKGFRGLPRPTTYLAHNAKNTGSVFAWRELSTTHLCS